MTQQERKKFLSLSYEMQKKYVYTCILRNNKSFEKTTHFILKNIDEIENEEHDFFRLYLKILSDLYNENIDIFYKDKKPIFDNKQDLALYVLGLRLPILMQKHPKYYKTFLASIKRELQSFNIQSLDLIEGSKEKGFYFDCLLYIPSNIENNTLIIEGNNSMMNQSKGETKSPTYLSETFELIGSFQYFLELNAPILVPLIPNVNAFISSTTPGYHERYARQLSRNTVNPDISTNPAITSKEDPLYRTDLQILHAKEYARQIIYQMTNTVIEKKSLLYGFSTPGNLAVRLGFLHPEEFCGIIAGGINAAIPLPIPSYRHTPLIYPVGTYDYEKITGKPFDNSVYLNLPQYYFTGEKEDQKEYNTVVMPLHHDSDVKNTYSCLSLDLYERLDTINKIYQNLGLKEDRIEVYQGYGHTPEPAISKIKNLAFQWVKENQKHLISPIK